MNQDQFMGNQTKCSRCGLPHDYDLSPDTGICVVCGGLLSDSEDVSPPGQILDLIEQTIQLLERKV